jgi:uncharacterized YigZ family protein
MSYRVARGRARFEQEIERSRFIGIAAPVSTPEEVQAELERLREEFPDATHHAWAYLLGDPEGSPKMRFDDDGEPSGTAGRPILNVLQRRKVGDTLLVVVRYFGGVKLGAGGLVRAYSGTASRLLDGVELAAPSPRFPLVIRLEYGDEQNARRILGRLGIAVVSADYSREVTLLVRASEDETKAALEEISEHTSGRARFGLEGDAI